MRKVGKPKRSVIITAAVVLAVVILTIGADKLKDIRVRERTLRDVIPQVQVVSADSGPETEKIILPGNVEAWHAATLFARTNGYVRKWYVDIGSRVKEGDLLADIEAPEVDAALGQAEADLKTAQANASIAGITANRWKRLLRTESVSLQDTEEKVSTKQAADAIVLANQSNRERLRQLVGFERVIAPFHGIISSRTTDIGALIDAGSQSTISPLFQIVQAEKLRIYVQVPQNYAPQLKPGMVVDLHFVEHPGKVWKATLFETANAFDLRTRTLQVQFTMNNPNLEILPGGYTEVHFNLPMSPKLIRLPVNTLLFRSAGLQVATVDKDNKVVLKSITLSRDFGDVVEVNTGLALGERVILNPSDGIVNGQTVHISKTREKVV